VRIKASLLHENRHASNTGNADLFVLLWLCQKPRNFASEDTFLCIREVSMSTIQNQRVFAASPEEVFAAHRDPERLARWWGPAGFTNTFTHFEFVPNGKWSFVMHGPDQSNYPNESIFRAIEENRFIQIAHVCEPFFVLDIRLTPEGSGTRVEWHATFENETFAKNLEAFLLNANEQNFDRLEAELGR
jgi:uncharacterized protein YndB with AHSA1/START domain